jgi:replication fork protection complex subunit Csm3/Swi3
VWRDEAKGLVNGIRLPAADNDNDSDANSDADGAPRGDEAAAAMAADQGASSSSQPSSPTRSRLRRRGAASDMTHMSDSEDDGNGLSLSSDASHPPPSSPGLDEAALELGALLEEEEAVRTSGHTAPTGHAWKASNDDDAVAMDEDDDLWDALDTGAPASAPATIPAPPVVDDDQDMWDLVHELEQEKEKEKEVARQPNPVQNAAAAVDTQVDDSNDLYL